MKSYFHQFNDNEAILLMYLADELPPQDRAEVEQMLSADPALAKELENLREAHELTMNSLRSLDAATRSAVPEIVALRHVSEMIRDWADQKSQAELMPALAIQRPMPWRRISVAAAAAMMVGYYIWAVYQPIRIPPSPPIAEVSDPYGLGISDPAPPPRTLTDDEKLAVLSNSLDDSISDDSSNLHVAEVAAMIPGGNDSGQNAPDQNAGEP
jgi:hypothetical protein